jgi:hypothetical protein
LDVDLNVVSTFGDNATKNFAYQIKFEETPDICIVHGGVNSLGCPWNDPASWDNTTEVHTVFLFLASLLSFPPNALILRTSLGFYSV